jgi:hypothetical protein
LGNDAGISALNSRTGFFYGIDRRVCVELFCNDRGMAKTGLAQGFENKFWGKS